MYDPDSKYYRLQCFEDFYVDHHAAFLDIVRGLDHGGDVMIYPPDAGLD